MEEDVGMTSATQQSLDALARALDQTAAVLAAVPADKLADATPCHDWDVGGLIAHVVAAPRNFIVMASGGEPDWSASPRLPEDWNAEFRSAADELLRTWRDVGESAAPQQMDWQTAEFAIHTWDLARATGQPTDLDPEVAQRGLDFMSTALTSDNRGEAFGPSVTLPPDASVSDRLVAFAGRDPR
jgi:uncharacterized protein (TIGR03086 family)